MPVAVPRAGLDGPKTNLKTSGPPEISRTLKILKKNKKIKVPERMRTILVLKYLGTYRMGGQIIVVPLPY